MNRHRADKPNRNVCLVCWPDSSHLELSTVVFVRRTASGAYLAASARLPSRTNVYSGGLPGNPRIASAG